MPRYQIAFVAIFGFIAGAVAWDLHCHLGFLEPVISFVIRSLTNLMTSFTWPLAIVMLAIMFRSSLNSLLNKIANIDAMGVKIRFRAGLDNAKKDLAHVGTKPSIADSDENTSHVPAVDIQSAWLDVETACRNLLRRKGRKVPNSYRALGSRLKEFRLVDELHGSVLDKLRNLRNIAMHPAAETLTESDAKEFVFLAEQMIEYLDKQSADLNINPSENEFPRKQS